MTQYQRQDEVLAELRERGRQAIIGATAGLSPQSTPVVESRGLVEFRYPDGRVVTADHSTYTKHVLTRGDSLEHDGTTWVMYDREDRAGVTASLFEPVGGAAPATGRARTRKPPRAWALR